MGITVILRAGSDSQGFSLLELLLVLLLLGVSSLIVLPSIDNGLRQREVRKSALGFAAAARELRRRAVYEGIPQRLVLNLVDRRYRVAQEGEVYLPSAVKFSAVEGGEAIEKDVRQFVFFPNGSSLGGKIGFSAGQNATSYSVRFEPLSGKVDVMRSDPS
ncbi:MAG TPA: prepilin-type N-terminal cleavage/methylation domain-containing protein [Terriglobales bacterium]|nr:prepilin-type N-terminal cleavage/methylation domain-containing protein [Terriglobales bacterium]